MVTGKVNDWVRLLPWVCEMRLQISHGKQVKEIEQIMEYGMNDKDLQNDKNLEQNVAVEVCFWGP